MIFDSYIWKNELKKVLTKFKKFISTTKIEVAPPDSNIFFFNVEKFFFITAYIVRKLNESNKLSDELTSTNIPVIKYPRKNKKTILDFMNNHHGQRFFNFKKQQKGSLHWLKLCEFLIHSFIFDPVFDDKDWKVIGIQVTSDKSKTYALYYIMLDDYLLFLEDVVNDHIVKASFSRISGEYKKSKSH